VIDKDRFAAGLGLLSGAFKTDLDPATATMYFRILSPRLSTADFERAITGVLANETFWPAPAVIAQYGAADGMTRALVAFEWLFDDLRAHGGFRFYPSERWSLFDAHLRFAISRIGGLRMLSDVTAERYPSLRKHFTKLYAEHVRTAGDVPAAALSSGRDRAITRGDR